MLETSLLYIRSNFFQNFKVRELLLNDGELAEPITLVRSRPERSVPLPEARYFIISFPVFDACGNRTCKRTG